MASDPFMSPKETALSNLLKEDLYGNKIVPVTQREFELYKRLESKLPHQQIKDTILKNLAGAVGSVADWTDPIIKGEDSKLTKLAKEYKRLWEEEQKAAARARIGGTGNLGTAAGEMYSYAAPTAKLGLIGTGGKTIKQSSLWDLIGSTAKSVPASYGVDYGISRLYGNTHEQALDDAAMGAMFVGALSGGRLGLKSAGLGYNKLEKSVKSDMAKHAGGGEPSMYKDEPDDAYTSSRVYDPYAEPVDPRTVTTQEASAFEPLQARAGKEISFRDQEISDIQKTFDELEKNPTEAIYNANKESFGDMPKEQAIKLLEDSDKMREGLKQDLEDSLFKKMNELDDKGLGARDEALKGTYKTRMSDKSIRKMDRKARVKAYEEQADQHIADMQVQLAELKKINSNRAKQKQNAKQAKEIKARQNRFENHTKQVTEAYDDLKAARATGSKAEVEMAEKWLDETMQKSYEARRSLGKYMADLEATPTAKEYGETISEARDLPYVGTQGIPKKLTKGEIKTRELEVEKRPKKLSTGAKDKQEIVKTQVEKTKLEKLEDSKTRLQKEIDSLWNSTDKTRYKSNIKLAEKKELELQKLEEEIAKEKGQKAPIKKEEPVNRKEADSKPNETVYFDKDIKGRLGFTDKYNVVHVKSNITHDEMQNYIKGNDNTPTSKQKQVVSKYMQQELGVDLADELLKLTERQLKKFVEEHERTHAKMSHAKNYYSNRNQEIAKKFGLADSNNKYLSDSAIQKEAEANKYALKKVTDYDETISIDVDKIKVKKQVAEQIDNRLERMAEHYKIDRETAKKFDDTLEDIKTIVKDITDRNPETFSNWKWDSDKTVIAEKMRDFHRWTQKAFDKASHHGRTVHQVIYEATGGVKGKVIREKLTKYVAMSDYHAIREFSSKSEAMKFFREHEAVYNEAKKEIDLLAKSMHDTRYMQNADHRNNAFAIAKKLKLEDSKIPIIDKLVSIKAMSDEAWGFVSANKDKPWFKVSMDIIEKQKKDSDELFKNNPYNNMKGYTSEVYDRLEADFSWKRGVMPTELQSKHKGTLHEFNELDPVTGDIVKTTRFPKEWDEAKRIEFARLNSLGIVLNKHGFPVQARTTASQAFKDAQGYLSEGRVYDFGQVMEQTTASTIKKQLVSRELVPKLLDNKEGVFSDVPKKDYVKFSNEELYMFPREMRDEIKYVRKDIKAEILGNKEIGIETKHDALNIAQMLVKDIVGEFKENVVLKNPVSYVNNIGFALFIARQNGIPLKEAVKHMREGVKLHGEMTRLSNAIAGKMAQGKPYDHLVRRLGQNELWKMHDQGMAMTVLSDIMSAPSFSRRSSSKALRLLTKKLVKDDKVADAISETTAFIYLSPNAKSGQFLINQFTKIDVMGRYALAKGLKSRNVSEIDAVNKANAIFGDLDKINPQWVQALSEFGGIPFAGWYHRISHGLGKNVLDNWKTALALGAVLYTAEEITGKRTESWNPALTLINTPFDMARMSPYLNMQSAIGTAHTPSVYRKLDRADSPMDLVLTDTF